SNPLLMDISLSGAQGLLISIVGGHDVTLFEVDEAANYIKKQVDPDANIIIGANFEETVEDFLQVSIVASGLPLAKSPKSDQKFDVQSSQLSHVGSAKKLSSGQGIDKAIGEDSEKKKTSSIVSTDVCYGSRSLNNEVQKKHIRPPALPHTILSTMSKDTQSDRSSSEEFARALSEVIGNRDGHIKKDIRLQKKMSNDTWRTADGVEFVDGFKPAFSTQHSPMKLTTSQLKSELTQDFSPRPPAEQPNRLPDVSEFPHIAQRVYQANTAQDESQLKNAVDMPNILKRLANLGKQLG
ncbi:MAG: hypothetical protein HRT83_02040, partial [Hyphomicrobiaceae bacterium]|nr:hypothetical protein [Hyphomicrobiaceae bacterium]